MKKENALLKRIPITPNGYQKLQEELDLLMKVERPKNIKDISEARAHGDLSENAEYHAAKERQSFIEGRIQELKTKIALANVIDPSKISQNRSRWYYKPVADAAPSVPLPALPEPVAGQSVMGRLS